MIRKISYLILLSLLVAAFMAMSATASSERVDRRVIDPTINKAQYYSFPNEHQRPTGLDGGSSTAPLGGFKSSSYTDSPGLLLGHTWYDYQRNGSMRRMVGTGQHRDEDPVLGAPDSVDVFAVHFNWMRLMPPLGADRAYAYQAWVDTVGGGGVLRFPGDGSPVQSAGDWAGYVVLDVDKSNRAVLGGHYDQGNAGHFTSSMWFDRVPLGAFYASTGVPDAIQEYDGAGGCVGQEVIWPAMAYQEGPTDTVLHIVASVSDADSQCLTALQSIYYFRKVGATNYGGSSIIPGTWDSPPYVIDTNFTLSHDIFASKTTGKVAMAWCAARPDPGDCDTCSSNTGSNSLGNSQLDNDIYYQISMDQGATWQPRVNLTKRPHPDSVSDATFWPYIDLNILLDQDDDELHITWNGRYYEPGSNTFLLACRLFHWSENLGFTTSNNYGPGGISDGKSRGVIRTAHNAVWDQTTCNGGAWQMNLSKMTMSQCNGKHYIVFVQFNDGPNNILNDCAARAFTGGGGGAANGELWVVVSNDGGVTWDKARNITKSFSGGDANTACQPPGGTTDPCESDHWPSTAPYGANYTTSGGVVVVPDGGSDPGWYVDLMYVNDPDAGGIPQNEGTWQQADMKWVRLACVEPIPAPNPVYSFQEIAYPSCGKHGQATVRNLTIENSGNVTWNYTLAKYETTGPAGWLTFASFDGAILSGLNNVETGQVTLNTGGLVNTPGTIVSLTGGLVFTTTGAFTQVDTIPIVHHIADTCVPPTVDTIQNNVVYLVVGSNGNFGNGGDGGVNMDFVHPDTSGYPGVECDSSNNVFLYDGSPIVMWVNGGDTVANWSIFSDGWLSDQGFRPRVGKHKFSSYLYDVYSTGVFSTNDSSIYLEKTWYSPKNYGANDQNFFVQCVKLWSADGLGKNNLTVGEAVDWDIPSDSAVDNASGFVYTAPSGSTPAFNMIYCQGANYNDGDTTECQNNAMRYGGVTARGTFVNGTLLNNGNIYDAFTIDNPTYVIPEGTYLPQQLYDKITATTGFETYSSTNPDSEYVDLSMVVTNLHQYNLGATDTLTMYYVFSTSLNTDPLNNGTGEFLDWMNAGVAFDNARIAYADWRFPTHISYGASSVTCAGDVTGGTGATATYNAGTNSTTLTGGAQTVYTAPSGKQLIVTKVAGGTQAFHRVSWITAETPSNPNGGDTLVFMHRGEGVGAAKVSTFSWYLSNDGNPAGNLTGPGFNDPSTLTNIDAFNTFIQNTSNLGNYTGWSPEVPAGNDLGVPRSINQTIISRAAVEDQWLYVKTTVDGGGGPYSNGTQIDGFEISFGCCQLGGNVNGIGGIDIADVTYLVAFAFKSGPAPPCPEEGNVNGIGGTDIADVTYLVAFAFKSGPPPPPCP
jgi:hypothetical protein